jgi:hypothetical protein
MIRLRRHLLESARGRSLRANSEALFQCQRRLIHLSNQTANISLELRLLTVFG